MAFKILCPTIWKTTVNAVRKDLTTFQRTLAPGGWRLASKLSGCVFWGSMFYTFVFLATSAREAAIIPRWLVAYHLVWEYYVTFCGDVSRIVRIFFAINYFLPDVAIGIQSIVYNHWLEGNLTIEDRFWNLSIHLIGISCIFAFMMHFPSDIQRVFKYLIWFDAATLRSMFMQVVLARNVLFPFYREISWSCCIGSILLALPTTGLYESCWQLRNHPLRFIIVFCAIMPEIIFSLGNVIWIQFTELDVEQYSLSFFTGRDKTWKFVSDNWIIMLTGVSIFMSIQAVRWRWNRKLRTETKGKLGGHRYSPTELGSPAKGTLPSHIKGGKNRSAKRLRTT